MRKKYIGKTSSLSLINNKVYEVISTEQGWYRIVDETSENYIYPPVFFVEEDEDGYRDQTVHEYILEHLEVSEKEEA